MTTKQSAYPVVDVFAGPGGLGEGFSAVRGDRDERRFRDTLSIERDEFSHRTLLLRHFFRSFPSDEPPEAYYQYLDGRITADELFRLHPVQFKQAQSSAIRLTLGEATHSDVRRLIASRLGRTKRWALVGGPPCQAYSLVGRSRMRGNPEFERDERHFLYREYLKIIADHRPPVFVMENVKGLLSATVEGESTIGRIVADLSRPRAALEGNRVGDLQYRLYSLSEDDAPAGNVDPRLFLVRSEEYGIPQARHRMFIVGIRSDLTIRPRRLRHRKPPTVREMIGDLPVIRSGLSRGEDNLRNWQSAISEVTEVNLGAELNGNPSAQAIVSSIRLSLEEAEGPEDRCSTKHPGRPASRRGAIAGLYDPGLRVLTSHESRSHMAADLRRYMFAAVFANVTGRSPKLSDFPPSLLPAHENVHLGREGKMFSDRFRVQLPDQVSTTITSHISKDGHYYIHYDPAQCRSLTVREAARLQTFPDNYKFEGPRTSQYHQVGNAVPPFLALQIAEIIADVLDAVGEDA